MEQLHQLNRKIRFIREQTYHDTEACKDVAQGSVKKLSNMSILRKCGFSK